MKSPAPQFSYQELCQLSVVLQVDIRVSDTLGLEVSDEQKRLFQKIQQLIQQMDIESGWLPQGEKS